MGVVYLAERADAEFEQKVALKITKRGMDTDEIIARFLHERQILASLNHENIAHLLDGGTTEDGLSYFVMEFIEGLPIDEYCRKNILSINDRLKLFRMVCSAVEYAHKNLVVHRDLKPSNIIVKRDGIPKLLDFGIAKVLNSDNLSDATRTGMKISAFTPDYASPEQIKGEHLTTATDVFSLGKVLSSLINESNNVKSENKLNFDESEIKTIIAKATHNDLERRYSTVERFSEDIKRYLNGLPISARPDTFSYRANKFIKRNKVAMIAATFVIITILGALTISIWQTIVARQERVKAEKRFHQVRKLANTVLFDYHDNVAKLTGSTPLREKMVKDSLEYLDNLSVESENDIQLQRELATAYEKIGDVQGNPFNSNLGDTNGALISYQKALEIRKKSYSISPKSLDLRRELIGSYQKLGNIFWANGDYQKSLDNYQKGLDIFQIMLAESQFENKDRIQNAKLEFLIGQTFSRMGKVNQSLEYFQKALVLHQKVLEIEPTNFDSQMGLVSSHIKIGDKLQNKNELDRSLENYQKALELLKDLVASKTTKDVTVNRLIGIIYSRIAVSKKEQGQLEEALKSSLNAISIQKEISDSDPKNVQIKLDLATSYSDIADISSKKGEKNDATEYFQKALLFYETELKKNPKWADLRKDMAIAYRMYGEFLSKYENENKALSSFHKAKETLNTDELKSENREELEKINELIKTFSKRKEA
jgi:serine/threonine protein kinase